MGGIASQFWGKKKGRSQNGTSLAPLGQTGGTSENARVLVVDDEQNVLNAMRRLLRREPFEIVTTVCPETALEYLAKEPFAVVVSDQRMPEMEGTRFLERARAISSDTIRIILTGFVDIQAAVEAINRGEVYRFITKPWKDEDLRTILRESVARFEIMKENMRLQALTERQNTRLKELNRNLAEIRRQELKIGSKIQQTLLLGKSFQESKKIKVAAFTMPSQEIDGDFYDFFRHGEECIDIVVGDVMGKGIPAALMGAAAKSEFIRAMGQLLLASQGRLFDPEEIVTHVHEKLTPELIGLESFVTLCYARFDLEKRRYHLVNCGHTRMIHLRDISGRCEMIQGDNMPLGFHEKERYEQTSGSIGSGDLFFFYSDGLTETQNKLKVPFGEERLLNAIKQNYWIDPRALVQKIGGDVVAFAQTKRPTDDLTCVAAKIQQL